MILLVENRPRDEQGRFMESSNLDEKITSARLHKGYRQKLTDIAKSMNITTAQLVRQILEDYVREYERNRNHSDRS
ncbi:hypothetical protein [Myxosarcina sp. GI1]|uniref:hypothetical protein n=1 Tax=Myxosarcina sp. GI1 TaxID=1541065 RepID=UPI000562568A|nr:hypothetical protein [Myxosarcina sp. GI1]